MKILLAALLFTLSSAFGLAQQATPALQRIADARRQIQTDPKKVQAYNDLSIAWMRRSRETDNPKYLKESEAALAQGLALDANDFQLQKTEIALLLCRHQFPAARAKAAVLNRRTPDDVMLYGYLAEADIAQGNYPEAEKSAQWMLNMLPNNIPGLLLGAKLRELYGDADGAIELLNLAYTETSPTETEDLAWIANQMASVQIASGKSAAAVPTLERTEQLFPGYPYTLANLARIRIDQHRPDEAIALLQSARQGSDDPELLYLLIEAQKGAGRKADAQASAVLFQRAASDASAEGTETRSHLILLDAENVATAPMALKLAQQEIAVRHDVWTEDAYAWALYANGSAGEADAAIKRAVAVGIQRAQIFDHAGHIASRLGHQEEASKDFELALRSDAASAYAADARQALKLPAASGEPVKAVAEPAVTMPAADSTPSGAAQVVPAKAVEPTSFAAVPVALLTPRATDTDRVIRSAQAAVAHAPKDATVYAALGAAYFQRARETGDVSDYQLAEQALNQSLSLDSADFSAEAALESMAEVCMGEHRFADALAYAQKALALGSGDVSPFAIVGDAYADMGEYAKAGLAYARLTPREMTLSARAAYARDSRISYLHFVQGDTSGAISLMKTAVAEGAEARLPAENLAWLYYELGEYLAQAGDVPSADAAYLAALAIHPGDYRSLAGLGRLRANNGRYTEAITLYQRAIAVVPMPIFVAELGDLYTKTGNQVEAEKQYQLVEYIGLLGQINQVLHNRDLAIFYADHDKKLAESLKLAQKEFEVRHDIYTYDALAWALYKNGRYAEAGQASEKGLQFGTRDALLLFHAGMIAERLGQRDLARTRLELALKINPHFRLLDAQTARESLGSLNTSATSLNTSTSYLSMGQVSHVQ